jgi:hypothetical protein
MAESIGLSKIEYVVFKRCTVFPVVEARGAALRDVHFADQALEVESPWVMTFVLDQSRLDRVVRGFGPGSHRFL